MPSNLNLSSSLIYAESTPKSGHVPRKEFFLSQTEKEVTKLRANDGVVLGVFAIDFSPQALVFDGASIW